MRTKIVFLAMACLILVSFFSCELREGKDVDKQTDYPTYQVEETKPSEKEENSEQDTVASLNQNDIDYLLKETAKVNSEIDELNKDMREFHDSRNTYITISIILLIIVIALVLYVFYKLGDKVDYKDMENRLKGQKNELTNLSQRFDSCLRDVQNSSGRQTSPRTPVRSSELENRINKIEMKMSMLDRNTTSMSSLGNTVATSYTTNNPHEDSLETAKKVGYAGINKGTYFLDIMNSQKETCVYKITFNTQDSAYFDLISLDKIKSRNGWDDVIEYEGDCSMEEASTYTLLDRGSIKRFDDKTWELTNKLKIKISK